MSIEPEKIEHLDLHVGAQLRRIRQSAGLSAGQFAKKADVSAQQLALYEEGKAHLTPNALWEFSNILDVRVSDFFEGME